jgi:hypothetical protein
VLCVKLLAVVLALWVCLQILSYETKEITSYLLRASKYPATWRLTRVQARFLLSEASDKSPG